MKILRQRTFSVNPEQREFNSKDQKLRLKKYYKSMAETDPGKLAKSLLNSSDITSEISKNVEKTSKKSGKNSDELFNSIQSKRAKQPFEDGEIALGRVKNKNNKPSDKLADKLTKEGMKNYKIERENFRNKIEKEIEENKLKKAKTIKNLKKGGIGALAIGGAIATGIGAKKLYDKKKSKKSEKK